LRAFAINDDGAVTLSSVRPGFQNFWIHNVSVRLFTATHQIAYFVKLRPDFFWGEMLTSFATGACFFAASIMQ